MSRRYTSRAASRERRPPVAPGPAGEAQSRCRAESPADHFAGEAVLRMVVCPPRSRPHSQIGPHQMLAIIALAFADPRQMHPGNGRMFVVDAVPVVVQPELVDRPADPDVARAARNVALG